MGTVSKEIAVEIMRGNYADDRPLRITKYENAWGGESFGVVFEGDMLDRYSESQYVRNPEIIWEIKNGYQPSF
jgi:hypothetical protein